MAKIEANSKRITVFVPIGYDITLKHVPKEQYFEANSSESPASPTRDELLLEEKVKIETRIKDHIDSMGKSLPKEVILSLGKKYLQCRKFKGMEEAVQDGLFSFTNKKGLNSRVGLYEMLNLIKSIPQKSGMKSSSKVVGKIKGIK